jgi:hypothetical protein
VDLGPMLEALDATPGVAQIVLLREACYPRELEGDGILGWPRAEFTPVGTNGSSMLTHRLFWSQNPSLYHRRLTSQPWPAAASSERVFGDRLLAADPRTRFALWGEGEPWISHIGEVRASSVY